MTTIDTRSGASISEPSGASPRVTQRFWPAIVLVAAFWIFVIASRIADWPISTVFMSNMGAAALLVLLFVGWWLFHRGVRLSDRLFALTAVIIGGAVAAIGCDPSVGAIGVVLFGAPVTLSAWLVWTMLTHRRSALVQRLGLLALLAVTWGNLLTVRVDGVDGDNNAKISWRWSPSAEDAYLSDRGADQRIAPAEDVAEAIELRPGDWPEFRGPNRQGELRGVKIATDWDTNPPKQLWRQRIGPAWSSVVIIGPRLYTQEQRGDTEAVVCLDGATGKEIWAHEDQVRFSDGQAGAGPRATPTFSDGRIYTLGATGVLNCLAASDGKPIWSRNIVADSGAPLPMWGFSSSPLVAEGVVCVWAGGANDKGLLAYRVDSGEPAWTHQTGPNSYSSPQLASLGGKPQILFLSDNGLISLEPVSGALRWDYEVPRSGIWRVVQPRQLDDNSLLIGSEDLGLVRLDVSPGENPAKPTPRWSSRALRPAYNDFVVADGYVYGFDESIFCCIDLRSSKRQWKAGRYGHGQVLLLADQGVLLVICENGEAVLLAANPEKNEELGRFQAIRGKTWNHPVIAHGRLYTRNDEEIACYELKLAEEP